MIRNAFIVSVATAGLFFAGPASASKDNDYPTEVIADYVFGCMATNGQSQEALRKCSCSIDVIADQLSYETYSEAETILRMRLVSGEKSVIFKTGARFKDKVAKLKRAQAEAEILCF